MNYIYRTEKKEKQTFLTGFISRKFKAYFKAQQKIYRQSVLLKIKFNFLRKNI